MREFGRRQYRVLRGRLDGEAYGDSLPRVDVCRNGRDDSSRDGNDVERALVVIALRLLVDACWIHCVNVIG